MEKVKDGLIEWGVASQAFDGQQKSGDMCLVKLLAREALVAVVDGLGHGDGAAAVAEIAIATLEACAGQSLVALVNHCHQALRQTRGAVMSLASLRPLDSTMSWLGVGNVEGSLWRANVQEFPGPASLVLQGGLVGDHLPRLRASRVAITKGDLLIFATDGVQPHFPDPMVLTYPPQQVAEGILARNSRGTDDALVLVARCVYGKDQASAR
jgi:serine phosphatase RsbU (regulator of sigma subunit)